MPLCADPSATTEYVLPIDQDKPEATRPTFVGRFLTCRQMGTVSAALDKAIKATTRDEEVAALLDALGLVLVGWRHMGVPDGDREGLLDVLTQGELWNVVYGLIGLARLGEVDRKKSESPSASAPVDGASPAV